MVFMGLHVAQMMGYEDIMNAYRFVTYNAAKTLHICDHYGIEAGKPANLVIFDASNYYDVLNNNATVLASYRNGIKIAEANPSEKKVLF